MFGFRMIPSKRASPLSIASKELAALMEEVHENGYGFISFPSDQSLLELALLFGEPVRTRQSGPLTDILRPSAKETVKRKSLSSAYGLAPFPFHTDLSYYLTPPRLVFLRLQQGASSETPTLLVDSRSLSLGHNELKYLQRDVWKVRNGYHVFLSPLLRNITLPTDTMLRYDTECMEPASSSFMTSAAIMKSALAMAKPCPYNWKDNMVLCIDNWRVLHGRGDCRETNYKMRVLERVSVKHRSNDG